jgi:hypothetical protein
MVSCVVVFLNAKIYAFALYKMAYMYNNRNILTSPCTLTTSPCCLSLLFCQHLKEKSLLPLISR